MMQPPTPGGSGITWINWPQGSWGADYFRALHSATIHSGDGPGMTRINWPQGS